MRFIIIHVLASPSPEFEAARALSAELTGSRQALRYPPHVTLRTGLVCPDDQAASVADEFLAHAATARPAKAWTDGLRCELYGSPERGLVALTVASDGTLAALHRHLLEYTAWPKGRQPDFHPHLTIAFDDLDAMGTRLLAKRLSGFESSLDFAFTVDSVSLYHETSDRWVEWGTIRLF